jgi:peptidoglycan/xylan/chitin deacetylase (PgdA/CDA1 family)
MIIENPKIAFLPILAIIIIFFLSGGAFANCAPQRTITLPENPAMYGDQYKQGLPLNDHEVVLTFDDGPHTKTTNQLLDHLKDRCLKVTFFIVGETALLNKETLLREIQEGHTIGSHSHNHPMPFNRLVPETAKEQITRGIAEIKSVVGDKLHKWFRFPGLGTSPRDEKLLKDMGISIFGIDIEPSDWERPGNKVMMQRIMSQLETKHKGIIVMHDIHQPSVDFVPILIDELVRKGYTFVHVE